MTKKIFSLRVAKELVRKGYDIIDVEMNLKKPTFKVYIFKVEGDFEEDLIEIANK